MPTNLKTQSLIFQHCSEKHTKTMDINTNFGEAETLPYLENHAKTDSDNMSESLIIESNFDINTAYGKTDNIFKLVNNDEFSPGASILNIDKAGFACSKLEDP